MTLACLISSLLLLASGQSPSDPELATGISQVQEGDFEGAVLTLDAVAGRLAAAPERSGEAARAFLYLGIAYVGLGQESLARSKFRQALLKDRALRLGPDEFSAKVIRAFEAARQALDSRGASEKEARKKSRKPLFLLGAGAAGAAGLAVALGGERPNSPPTASFSISPEGQAIAFITQMTFSAVASDPDNDSLTYSWNFGDGAAAGTTVTHVFTNVGTLAVRLTVSDGLATTTVTGSVTSRTLTGRWRFSGPVPGLLELVLQQTGQGDNRFYIEPVFADATFDPVQSAGGRIFDPRRVELGITGVKDYQVSFAGEADATLQTLTGLVTCHGIFYGISCPPGSPATLVRE